MKRYFMKLAYDGSNYHGWQKQPNGSSVQETVMQALFTFLRQSILVVGAGRTDAGVHASCMIAHFDYEQPLDLELLTDKLNRILPPDIVVYWVREVDATAHARFDATYRTYQYHVALQKTPFNRHYCTKLYGTFDFDLMNQAAKHLFDYTDFTSFSKLHTDVKTNNCKVMKACWTQTNAYEWMFEIQADRFLRNMVRAIVGTLLEVGRHKMTVAQFCEVIEQMDRGKAGSSVPGNALFLVDIGYPSSLYKTPLED